MGDWSRATSAPRQGPLGMPFLESGHNCRDKSFVEREGADSQEAGNSDVPGPAWRTEVSVHPFPQSWGRGAACCVSCSFQKENQMLLQTWAGGSLEKSYGRLNGSQEFWGRSLEGTDTAFPAVSYWISCKSSWDPVPLEVAAGRAALCPACHQ